MAANDIPDTTQLIASALRLPLDDRITLVNAMLESVAGVSENLSQSEVDKSWNDEIAKRIEELEKGKVEPIPSTELWDKLGGKPNA